MTFKEALVHDSDVVFTNPLEFGEEVNIDGLTVRAVRGETAGFLARAAVSSTTATGFGSGAMEPELPVCDLALNVMTEDLPQNIKSGGVVTVNDAQYFVQSRHDGLGGMTRLELARAGF